MTLEEAAAYLEGIDSKQCEKWEQIRSIFYVIAQTNSTKKLDVKKIFPLVWDSEKNEKIPDTKECREALRKKALLIQNLKDKK